MPKERNKPIGEVECAHRGCDLKAQVFKFRSKAQHEWQQRRAGKLYACCERGHRCEDQDYLLEHATIWGAKSDAETAPVPHESASVKTAEKPAAAPVPKAPARMSTAPTQKPQQRPAPESSATMKDGTRTSEKTEAPTLTNDGGWGWFK